MKLKIKTVKQFETSTGKTVDTLDAWKDEELAAILPEPILPANIRANASAVQDILKAGSKKGRGPNKAKAPATPAA